MRWLLYQIEVLIVGDFVKVLVMLADGFEEVEAITSIDVLRRAGIDVRTVGLGKYLVEGAHKIFVWADENSEKNSIPNDVDMIVLPGGMPGTLNLKKDKFVNQMIDFCIDNGKYIAAICAAPSILGERGLLKGIRATCYPGFEKSLIGAQVVKDSCVVDGQFITANGPGSAMEFALILVKVLQGYQMSDQIREGL